MIQLIRRSIGLAMSVILSLLSIFSISLLQAQDQEAPAKYFHGTQLSTLIMMVYQKDLALKSFADCLSEGSNIVCGERSIGIGRGGDNLKGISAMGPENLDVALEYAKGTFSKKFNLQEEYSKISLDTISQFLKNIQTNINSNSDFFQKKIEELELQIATKINLKKENEFKGIGGKEEKDEYEDEYEDDLMIWQYELGIYQDQLKKLKEANPLRNSATFKLQLMAIRNIRIWDPSLYQKLKGELLAFLKEERIKYHEPYLQEFFEKFSQELSVSHHSFLLKKQDKLMVEEAVPLIFGIKEKPMVKKGIMEGEIILPSPLTLGEDIVEIYTFRHYIPYIQNLLEGIQDHYSIKNIRLHSLEDARSLFQSHKSGRCLGDGN